MEHDQNPAGINIGSSIFIMILSTRKGLNNMVLTQGMIFEV